MTTSDRPGTVGVLFENGDASGGTTGPYGDPVQRISFENVGVPDR